MENLTLEEQYKFYLKKVNLDEAKMHESQKIETKRAFAAGFSQMLVIMTSDISVLQQEEGVQLIDSLMTQCKEFWKSQV